MKARTRIIQALACATIVVVIWSLPVDLTDHRKVDTFKSVPISDSVSIALRSVHGNLWFGQYEVTQAQWEAVMGKPVEFGMRMAWRSNSGDHPVVSVSWDNCMEFLEKLNALPSVKESGFGFRLPTAEEWRAACRAGATGNYCRLADGTEISKDSLDRVAWYLGNLDRGNRTPQSVGQKQPNAFGLYDMLGNVREWTSSGSVFLYNSGGTQRICCGGSYSDIDCSASSSSIESPDFGQSCIGFRLCAEKNDP